MFVNGEEEQEAGSDKVRAETIAMGVSYYDSKVKRSVIATFCC